MSHDDPELQRKKERAEKIAVLTAYDATMARLLDRAVPHAWRLWEYSWRPARAGRHTLMARATDRRGRTQPMQHDPDRRNTMISHVVPIEVEVR